MLKSIFSIVFIVVLAAPHLARAIESADVLPADVRSLSVKMGTLTGLNQYYTESGQLKYISDINAVNLDVNTLSNIDGSVRHLVNILNQFGPDNLGDQLYLGQLKVDTNPEVQYFAPVFLYGQSPRLTVGFGIPIVKYTNQLSVGLNGSNLAELRAQFAGVSSDLDAAINQLNVDLVRSFQNTLTDKGYKRIENKDETFIGDVQVISAYQLPYYKNIKSVMQLFVGLPTGPQPDADDLTDIETFGRWTLKPALIGERRLSAQTKLMAAASYQAVLPSDVDKRVPRNAEDQLPESSQKDNLREDIGDTWALTGGLSWAITSSYKAGFAYAYEQKERDQYAASAKGDATLLARNTDRRANVAKFELGYSTVQDFMNKKAMVPATISYELSQVISTPFTENRNVENQTRHELWLSIYF